MQVIRYIKRKDLDAQKWDTCIDNADNGLIYAYSFYLDALCDNWDALIMGDYEAVMPLPWRKKWGFKYVYQPAFLQRLGVFGNTTPVTLNLFFQQANQKFSFLHFNVSEKPELNDIVLIERMNFIIDLYDGYTSINASYTKECKKNISKAVSRGCNYTTYIDLETVIKSYRNAYGHLVQRQTNADYDKLSAALKICLKQHKAILGGVTDDAGNKIYSAILLKDKRRLYYLLGAPTLSGREKRAPYYFIDTILNKHAGESLIFDFEGSDIPNVAAFYSKFTPKFETYYEVKINKLPWFIKWLKR